jgi:hypothetical protein
LDFGVQQIHDAVAPILHGIFKAMGMQTVI